MEREPLQIQLSSVIKAGLLANILIKRETFSNLGVYKRQKCSYLATN